MFNFAVSENLGRSGGCYLKSRSIQVVSDFDPLHYNRTSMHQPERQHAPPRGSARHRCGRRRRHRAGAARTSRGTSSCRNRGAARPGYCQSSRSTAACCRAARTGTRPGRTRAASSSNRRRANRRVASIALAPNGPRWRLILTRPSRSRRGLSACSWWLWQSLWCAT